MSLYEKLIERLDAFVRKYYANQLLRGGLVLLCCLLGYILTIVLGEYFFYLPAWLKICLVSVFILAGGIALITWVIRPLAKMARLGKIISHEQAAHIIGAHFPEVSDQLLNILQLKQQEETAESKQLIEASIEQKLRNIAPVPMAQAVDLSRNRKYLPYLLPLVLACVFILVAAPNVFKDASARLLQPTRNFEKPAPFKFHVLSLPLQAVRNGDFTLKINITGDAIPSSAFVSLGEEQIAMQQGAHQQFEYTFKNLNENLSFRIYAAGYYSEIYTIKVLQRPVLKGFKLHIEYPAYTGRKNEDRNGISDMVLPQGTNVTWNMASEHTDKAFFQLGTGPAAALANANNTFNFHYRFLNDTSYSVLLQNNESNRQERYTYKVQVIPDQYPVIQVQEFKDTVSGKQVVLNGTAGDDYGVSRVLFHYQISDAQGKAVSAKAVPLAISAGSLTVFKHYFDIESLNLQPGQKLSYFIEAWDNDGVHGSKAARSETMYYQAYNLKQIDSAMSKNAQQINSGLSNSAQQMKQLQNEVQDMQSKLLQSNQSDWQQKQSVNELAQKQLQLKNNLEQIKKRFEEQVKQSEQKNYSEDLKEKQEAVKAQMDNLLNKELKEQMQKLQELLQQLNKEQSMQQMQQMQEENKLFNMDLERIQELMKKLELQMKLEDMAGKMEKLAEQQSQLRKETDEAKKDNSGLSKEQQDLKKQLQDALNKELKDMKQMAGQMQQKQDLSKEEQQGQQAQEEMQQSQQQLDKQQNSKSSESQSKAVQNLQEMAASLRQQASGMSMEQIEIDIKAVRQLLTNLVRLSFDEEQLMKSVKTTAYNNPEYLKNQEVQQKLHSNSLLIRDSLFALSKRIFKLGPTVNKETTQLEKNMRASLTALQERRGPDAASRQQYVMMHTNNLALMLNEVLSNLMEQQSQSQSKKSGNSGSCTKPGGSTPKQGAGKQLSDIISKQKGLGQSMQQAGQPKNSKTGQQNGQSGSGGQSNGEGEENAEELVRLAQEQAAIRRQLQQLNSLLNSKGMGNAKEIKEIQEQMDKNETDLVNKKLDAAFQMRQREIMTRLLEAEKSLREQEQDDKRSSKNPEEISRPVPPELQQYLKDNQELLEHYKTVPPALKPYYKQMVEQYFQSVGNH